MENDLISRKAAIDAIEGLPKYFDKKDILCLDYADVLAVLSEHLPSAEQKSGRYVDLSERVIGYYYDDEYEEWIEKTVTVEELLDTACEDYTVVEFGAERKEK